MPAGKKDKRIALFLENIKKHPQHKTLIPDISTYYNTHTYMSFRCSKHNTFFKVKPSVINLKRGGCPVCLEEARLAKHRIKRVPSFIKKAKKIHGEKYDYSEIEYVNQYVKLKIICPIHGAFFQSPTVHIHTKCGCPGCSDSSGERAIGQYLRSKNIQFEYQYPVKINGGRYYFDFYLPDYNLIIEYDGKQHYAPIKFFGGKDAFKKTQKRDMIKNQYCIDNKINIVRVPYTCNDIYDTLNKLLLSNINNFQFPPAEPLLNSVSEG